MEEVASGRDGMEIDGFDHEGKAKGQENSVSDGFNANYLKVYYGISL